MVCYTYGAYAIGNTAFRDDFNSKIPNFFRCVNDRDVVPHFVPAAFGFVHAGILVHMTDTKCYFNQPVTESPPGGGNALSERLTDHKCPKYASLLNMFDCLSSMTDAQAAKCERAWVNYTTPQTASVVSSLVPDADGAMTVVFDRVVSTNLGAIGIAFRDEFEAGSKAKGGSGVTLKDFRHALHATLGQGKLVIAYEDFVKVVYDLLYDLDKEKRQSRIRISRWIATFRKYDLDFDGFLSAKEFKTMCRQEIGITREEDIRNVSDAIDMDIDGFISEEEFLVWSLAMVVS